MNAITEEPTTIQARLVVITPTLAEQLLDRNDHNRSVQTSRVRQYAADIRRGEWQVNGEAIKIAHDGRILDGQHRLMAILEADTEMQTLLITGLDHSTQETMDQGQPRSFADVLKLRGEKYHTGLAGASRIVFIYERDGIPFTVGGSGQPSVPQLSRTLERNPDLRVSVKRAYALMRPWMPVTLLGGLHYLFASADQEAADAFTDSLASGTNLAPGNPIYVLRERLIYEHAATDERRISARVKAAFVVISWNAFMDGEDIEKLRWIPGGANPDRFPLIRGLARADSPTGPPPYPDGGVAAQVGGA